LAAEIGRKAVALQLDTGNVRALDFFVTSVSHTLDQLGTTRFDYLVNNAGISHHASIEKNSVGHFDGNVSCRGC
jgi:hypothetical protein